MKIAFLTTDNRENDRRYDLTTPYFGTAPDALLQGFAGLAELEIHVVSCTQRPMQSPKKLADNIWFHSLHVPKIGWLRTGYQGCIRATRRFLRKLQPDIVHGQGTERDCAISAVFSGLPNIITIHGNMKLIASLRKSPCFSFDWLAARLETFTVPRSDGVVCITQYTQQAVSTLARRTWVVTNAVDSSLFDVVRQPETLPLILCVGTICPRKNQNAFVRALDPVARQHEFRVVFLGSGLENDPYVREFHSLVQQREWCEFRGFVDRRSLRQWLARAHVMVLPSLEDNCPMCVLEAAAAGVPVLAANVGGIPDLIQDGSTGVLCDPRSVTSMAAGVQRLLSSEALCTHVSQNGRNQALKRFHPIVVAEQHVRIYEEVIRE